MRLIDADALRCRMYEEAFLKDSDMQKWDSGCWIRYKLFATVLEEQPTIEPEHSCPIELPGHGWIPCSERLPNKNGKYIVTEQNFGGHNDAEIHDVTVHMIYFYADVEEWEDSERHYVLSASNITAWMPLPEPYREEGDHE